MSVETHSSAVKAVHSIEGVLKDMGFTAMPPMQQGFATWFSFRKTNCEVRLVCGPPGYHMEMFIQMNKVTGVRIYELADLMRIWTLAEWIRTNRLVLQDTDQLCGETLWFVDLLRIALPELEQQF